VPLILICRPCCRGDVVIIAAMVNRTFASSMEVTCH
jgi:acyl-CoA hydrolase